MQNRMSKRGTVLLAISAGILGLWTLTASGQTIAITNLSF